MELSKETIEKYMQTSIHTWVTNGKPLINDVWITNIMTVIKVQWH